MPCFTEYSALAVENVPCFTAYSAFRRGGICRNLRNISAQPPPSKSYPQAGFDFWRNIMPKLRTIKRQNNTPVIKGAPPMRPIGGMPDSLRRAWKRFRAPYTSNNHKWRKVRLLVLERDGWKCVKCGSTENLEVDHKVEPRDGGAAFPPLSGLWTLCKKCHSRKTRDVAKLRMGRMI